MSSSGDSGDSVLRVIVGPTGAGKTALAVRLAERFGATIIGADSRQIYSGFDIGTGKPSREERERVSHAGLDVAKPAERWSAAHWALHAERWIEDARARRQTPVIVGGTGFWVSALVAPLSPIPELDPVRRAALSDELDRLTPQSIRTWCESLDPAISRKGGPVQWRRAIEVALLTGHRLSDIHASAPRSPTSHPRYLVLDPGDSLDTRISSRVDAMLDAGWEHEVRALMQTVPPSAIAWKACGYERLRRAVEVGEPTIGARDEIVTETRRYARRQRTWFRRQLAHGPVTRLDPRAADAWRRAQAWWQGANDE